MRCLFESALKALNCHSNIIDLFCGDQFIGTLMDFFFKIEKFSSASKHAFLKAESRVMLNSDTDKMLFISEIDSITLYQMFTFLSP